MGEQLDLDDPAPIRYARWLGGALQGDLGRPVRVDQPVADLIDRPALNTAVLAAATFAAISAAALVLAALGGIREWPRTAAAASGAALIGGAVVVERVFAFPGLGSMLVDRIGSHDAPVIEAIALLQAAARIAPSAPTPACASSARSASSPRPASSASPRRPPPSTGAP